MQFVVSPCISIATSLVRVSAKFVFTFAVVILDVNDIVRDGWRMIIRQVRDKVSTRAKWLIRLVLISHFRSSSTPPWM